MLKMQDHRVKHGRTYIFPSVDGCTVAPCCIHIFPKKTKKRYARLCLWKLIEPPDHSALSHWSALEFMWIPVCFRGAHIFKHSLHLFTLYFNRGQYVPFLFTTKMNHMPRSYDLTNWGWMFENTASHGPPLLGLTKMICSFPLAPSDLLKPPNPPNLFHQLESSTQICVFQMKLCLNHEVVQFPFDYYENWYSKTWNLDLENYILMQRRYDNLRSFGLPFWSILVPKFVVGGAESPNHGIKWGSSP